MTAITPRCTAQARTTGDRCRNHAMIGATVCRMHGGSAGQVRRAAAARLEAMTHPALDRLEALLDTEDDALALRTVTAVLDRVGFHPSHGLELSGHIDYSNLSDVELARIVLDDPTVRDLLAAEDDATELLPDRAPTVNDEEGPAP